MSGKRKIYVQYAYSGGEGCVYLTVTGPVFAEASFRSTIAHIREESRIEGPVIIRNVIELHEEVLP